MTRPTLASSLPAPPAVDAQVIEIQSVRSLQREGLDAHLRAVLPPISLVARQLRRRAGGETSEAEFEERVGEAASRSSRSKAFATRFGPAGRVAVEEVESFAVEGGML